MTVAVKRGNHAVLDALVTELQTNPRPSIFHYSSVKVTPDGEGQSLAPEDVRKGLDYLERVYGLVAHSYRGADWRIVGDLNDYWVLRDVRGGKYNLYHEGTTRTRGEKTSPSAKVCECGIVLAPAEKECAACGREA